MADVKKNVIVNHSSEKMFHLVDRIEDYPLFLPWCGGSKVLERNNDITKASIHINLVASTKVSPRKILKTTHIA